MTKDIDLDALQEQKPCPFCGGLLQEDGHTSDCYITLRLFNVKLTREEWDAAWNRRSALTASEAPATEQAPPLPEPMRYVWPERDCCFPCHYTPAGPGGPNAPPRGDGLRSFGIYNADHVREYAEQYAAWKIAALRSEQAPEGEVPMGSRELNDACWSFVDAMPHQLPGPIWNNLKPAIKAAIEKYLVLSTPLAVPHGLRKQIMDALEIGLDCAQDVAAETHERYKGYKPARHAAVDRDVQTVQGAIAALSAAPAAPQGEQPE